MVVVEIALAVFDWTALHHTCDRATICGPANCGIVGAYLIFYTFDAEQIQVWRVLHGGRQIKPRQFRR
jgi:plasmid stabilization system protein ParE